MVKAYIAGPLFTPAERMCLEEIDAFCKEMGISSHLPHRDSGLLISGTDTDWSKRIFEADVQAIKSADLIIGVLNGPKADDGAAWELGYAYALRKPIIALIEDLRIRVINNINPMLLNSVKLTRSISELKAALADYVKR